ncbi:AbrB/MazE/SpoVT family DNA-binding domain-containing protein [Algoriphagus aquimarinus]|uniref:Transcriptional regulator/antitoxin, MazE n=1 Tax=Algoriphagus aquimarinus TaxID=237018 RepID=A0A1I0V6R4_9BACT|nr:AbrB/MazE/SpoVT family DNA-binding domain-containing protein [Algoriphagus aquimarinus]SFA72054.1 transcriptional regulator/antitoxin, MazE [Algoriphagus aquimarinus]
MEVSIIQIGNSKGLRLSKTIIEKYGLIDKVEIILEEDQIVLKPIKNVREGWGDSFAEMHAQGDDHLLIDDVLEDENLEEWK